ncbi:MAG: GMC family oxidoreductase [Steroidobacteraceae bacterium]
MLIDARSVDGGSAFECDLCVVGSGPAGIAIADRLRDSGLNLMLLEAGGQDYELPAQKLYRGQIVGRPYYRLDACRWRMFGGGTNRWGGWCRPLDRADYAERAWLALSGWPISAESLQVYEEAAATLFELPSPRFDLDAWRDRMPSPLALDGTNFENGLIQHSPETNFADRYGPRLIAAPNIRVMLHANVTELKLDADSRCVREVTVATLTGRRIAVRAKAVVLAAGGIENARLLLASRGDRAAGVGNEFDMVGRCFMEHLHVHMGHLIAATGTPDRGFYRKETYGAARLRGVVMPTAAAQEHHHLLSTSIAIEGPSYSQGTAYLGWPPAVMFAPVRVYRAFRGRGLTRVSDKLKYFSHAAHSVPNRLRTWWEARRALSDAAISGPGLAYSLHFRAEQAPDPANRVVLGEQRDALGMPQSRLEWQISPFDARSITEWLALLRQDVKARGIGEVIPPPDNWQDRVIGGPHHMGTTRMSADPRRGVVDADCRVHSVDNLYIAGSSVFATSGHANPTFTLVALALRLADTLRKRLAA